FFVTRDRRLLDEAEGIERNWNVVVISPIELILRYDELRRQADYQPANLSGTNIRIGLISADDINLVTVQFRAQGERAGEWASLVRSALTQGDRFECLAVRSQGDELVAVVI